MASTLNITNGDSAVTVMQAAGIGGDMLPWRDVLHEGPVPAGLKLTELSEVRAGFIGRQGWGEVDAVRRDFIQRDQQLAACADYEKVMLWFEHDLYDQLQILQILDWFADHRPSGLTLSMICTEQYLGMATPAQINELLPFEKSISDAQLHTAKKAWAAFRSSSPMALLQLLDEDLSALAFLRDALMRLLQEYPGSLNGLSRTAQKALEIIAAGESRPGRVFGAYQQTEARRFLGDSSFWEMLHQLLAARPPLIALPPGKQLTLPTNADQTLRITNDGAAVLQHKRNFLDMYNIDRWIGGVHLTPEYLWCWDEEKGTLIKPGD